MHCWFSSSISFADGERSGAPGAASLSNLTVATGDYSAAGPDQAGAGGGSPGSRQGQAVNSSVQSTQCGVGTQDTVNTDPEAGPTFCDISP